MSRDEITKKVLSAMRSIGLDAEGVSDGCRLVEDLGGDSLDLIEVVLELETEFDIEMPDNEVETIKTVGDLVNIIEAKLEAKEKKRCRKSVAKPA